jgi:hypothetical protein
MIATIMTELTTADSYIVRIYRIDTEDPKKLTGLVEAMDGSGERTPFTDIEELAAVLNGLVPGHRKERRKKEVRSSKRTENDDIQIARDGQRR